MPDVPANLCTCFGLSAADVQSLALRRGLTSVDEVSAISPAGTGCRTCVPDIEKLLETLWKDQPRPEKKTSSPSEIVRDALRPFLNRGTWELQLIDVEGPVVRIRAIPKGEHCTTGEDTLRQFVDNRLKELYRPDAEALFV